MVWPRCSLCALSLSRCFLPSRTVQGAGGIIRRSQTGQQEPTTRPGAQRLSSSCLWTRCEKLGYANRARATTFQVAQYDGSAPGASSFIHFLVFAPGRAGPGADDATITRTTTSIFGADASPISFDGGENRCCYRDLENHAEV